MTGVKDLFPEHLEEHPVWTWDEAMEHLVPVPACRHLPTDADVFVKARLTAADGTEFSGYVVGTFRAIALTILHNRDQFTFNAGLPRLAAAELNRLRKATKNKRLLLFPLRYSTDFAWEGDRRFEGTFEIRG
ncbi:MAG: hypothetical protein KDD82_14510 [Planctomycetes bacterium]|nr:hypothetical protein [Planctomycetota bacterium]